ACFICASVTWSANSPVSLSEPNAASETSRYSIETFSRGCALDAFTISPLASERLNLTKHEGGCQLTGSYPVGRCTKTDPSFLMITTRSPQSNVDDARPS